MAPGVSSSSSPCASCKLLRRRCTKECIFAPYFPPDQPHKFALVHKVFGASNVSKMLQELGMHERADAVSSLVYEANARVRDPVYGCVGAISYLQNQVSELQLQLAVAQAEILSIQMHHHHYQDPSPALPPIVTNNIDHLHHHDKSALLEAMSHCSNGFGPFGYGSAGGGGTTPSTNNIGGIQDPRKRESLWT